MSAMRAGARIRLPDRGAFVRLGVVGPSRVRSVNVGVARALRVKRGWTGIDKRPVTGPVAVERPAGRASGMAGDTICDTASHGGPDQAVYAFAREDLDVWERRSGRPLTDGCFGENLTTVGLDVTEARLGERWRLGDDLVLQVTAPRIPCATFAVWMGHRGWLRDFVADDRPGAYLRVLQPGLVQAGDRITVEHRPAHDVTVGRCFRALTREHDRLPDLLVADAYLTDELRSRAERRSGFTIDIDDGEPADPRPAGRTRHRASRPPGPPRSRDERS